jgi:hypothetical protein
VEGDITTFTVPGSTLTSLVAINAAGEIAGNSIEGADFYGSACYTNGSIAKFNPGISFFRTWALTRQVPFSPTVPLEVSFYGRRTEPAAHSEFPAAISPPPQASTIPTWFRGTTTRYGVFVAFYGCRKRTSPNK